MDTKEEYLKEGQRLIKLIDEQTDDTPAVKVPNWLKIGEDLKFYFNWKTQGFTKSIGWFHNTEKVYL